MCKRIVIVGVLSLVLLIGVLQLFGLNSSTHYILAGLLFVAISVIVHFGVKNFTKRRLKFASFLGVPFGLAFWFGAKITYQSIEIGAIGWGDIIALPAAILLSILAYINILWLFDRFETGRQEVQVKKKTWLFISLVIFLLWMPLFLIFFPGQVSVDSAVTISQSIGEKALSNWHPILYTLLLAGPLNLGRAITGDLTAGIALSVICQMLVLALVFGYVAVWVQRNTGRKWLRNAFMVFWGICPIVSCYSMTLWKDVIFAAVFLLLIVKIYDFVTLYGKMTIGKWKDVVAIGILSVLVAFFRNGGILILLTVGVTLLIYYKNIFMRRRIGLILGVGIVITAVIQGPVYSLLGISSSPFMESMSVPAQQFGYLASTKKLNEEELGALGEYVDTNVLASNYLPMDADPAKNSFDYAKVDEDKGGFLTLWGRMLFPHFLDYVKAYLLQMYSYWYVQGYSWSLSYEHNHDAEWMETKYTDVSLLGSSARELMQKIQLKLMSMPWFGWMGNVGCIVWMLVTILAIYFYQRRYAMLLVVAPLIVYLGSLLVAAPIAGAFRYVYSIFLALPVLIVVGFVNNKKSGKIK